MKHYIRLLFVLIGVVVCTAWVANAALTNPQTKEVDTSVNNLGASYNTTFPQKFMSGFLPNNHICVQNQTSTDLYVNCSGTSAAAPSDTDTRNLKVPANTTQCRDNWPIEQACYARSSSGTISSGTVSIELWRSKV